MSPFHTKQLNLNFKWQIELWVVRTLLLVKNNNTARFKGVDNLLVASQTILYACMHASVSNVRRGRFKKDSAAPPTGHREKSAADRTQQPQSFLTPPWQIKVIFIITFYFLFNIRPDTIPE